MVLACLASESLLALALATLNVCELWKEDDSVNDESARCSPLASPRAESSNEYDANECPEWALLSASGDASGRAPVPAPLCTARIMWDFAPYSVPRGAWGVASSPRALRSLERHESRSPSCECASPAESRSTTQDRAHGGAHEAESRACHESRESRSSVESRAESRKSLPLAVRFGRRAETVT